MGHFAMELVVLLICSGLQAGRSAKILALLNVASRSHNIFNTALTIALAERGHQVTVITTEAGKRPTPNLKTIVMDTAYDASRDNFDFESFVETPILERISNLYEWGCFTCEEGLRSVGAQQLLNYSSTERFDLIIAEAGFGECFFGFIYKFGSPPVVATSGAGINPWNCLMNGNPENPSYIPNYMLSYTSHMTFSERIFNFVIHIIMTSLYQYSYIPKQEAIARKYFKEDLPSFMDLSKNFSIILVNTLVGLDDPRPLLPSVIPIGGMHVAEQPDPLPKDLKLFLDEAKDGFMLLSLGSNLRSNMLSLEKRQAFVEAFSELSQRVVWKYESDTLPGQTPNLWIGKWLPQSSILAHPNIRVFMTHGGRMSSIEAAYRGVPVVGIPFFLDQKDNVQNFLAKGLGVKLDYTTLTKENILSAVREILNNDSYRQNMKELSAVIRNQPQSALDRAVYWTEYVIRHKGAPHLRSVAADLPWYQYLLLDVIFILTTGVLLVTFIVYLTLRTVYKILTGKNIRKEKFE